jgi:hypothetical protein
MADTQRRQRHGRDWAYPAAATFLAVLLGTGFLGSWLNLGPHALDTRDFPAIHAMIFGALVATVATPLVMAVAGVTMSRRRSMRHPRGRAHA